MKRIFVVALQQVKFGTDLSTPIELLEGMTLCEYSKPLFLELGIEFENQIGKLESNTLAASPGIIVYRDQLESELGGQDLLNKCLETTQGFLHFLWLTKDNAANVELGFLKEEIGNGKMYCHSNSRSNFMTTATGSTDEVKFSEQELNNSIDKFRKLRRGHRRDSKETNLTKNANRFAVFFYHLQAARSISDTALKIANYCTGLEAIFSTSTSELAHQLSERTALFIGSTPNGKMEIYRIIKSAYGIRSKVNHGATIKEGQVKLLPDLSMRVDELIRKIFAKIEEDEILSKLFSASSDDIDEYFLKLLMGVQPGLT